MKKNYPAILILVIALASCKKQDTISLLETKTGILTTGTWRITGYSRYDVFGYHDVYATLSDCRKDDYHRFNRNGTAEINEGPTTCNIIDPQSKLIQWKFLNNYANRIEIDGREYIVERLDDNEFIIYTKDTDPYAPQSTITYSR